MMRLNYVVDILGHFGTFWNNLGQFGIFYEEFGVFRLFSSYRDAKMRGRQRKRERERENSINQQDNLLINITIG